MPGKQHKVLSSTNLALMGAWGYIEGEIRLARSWAPDINIFPADLEGSLWCTSPQQ